MSIDDLITWLLQGKGSQETYWLIGEDPSAQLERLRVARRRLRSNKNRSKAGGGGSRTTAYLNRKMLRNCSQTQNELGHGATSVWNNMTAISDGLCLEPDGLLSCGLAESVINILPRSVTDQMTYVRIT